MVFTHIDQLTLNISLTNLLVVDVAHSDLLAVKNDLPDLLAVKITSVYFSICCQETVP